MLLCSVVADVILVLSVMRVVGGVLLWIICVFRGIFVLLWIVVCEWVLFCLLMSCC